MFHNVKIVGNGDMLPCLVKYKKQSVMTLARAQVAILGKGWEEVRDWYNW